MLATPCWAQEKSIDTKSETELRSELSAFRPFIGTWVFDGAFKNGRKLWAKNQYEIGMNGNFVTATTFAKDGKGNEYERYKTVWRWDGEKQKVIAHGFTSDGSYDETVMEIDTSDEGKPSISSITSAKGAPVGMKHTMKIVDETSFSWKVWSTASKEPLLLDGVWQKQ